MSPARSSRSPGPTRSSSSTRAAPTIRSPSPSATRRGWCSTSGPATARRRTTPPISRRTTGFSPSMPTSGWRRRSPARFGRCCSRGRKPPATRSHASRIISADGFAAPTGTRTITCGSTTAAPPAGAKRRCTSPSSARGASSGCVASCCIIPIATSRNISRKSIATRRSSPVSGRPTAGGRRRGKPSCIRGSPSSRNFILRRGFLDGHTGLVVSMLNSYYVFLKYVKLFEMQQTGSGAAAPSARDADPASGAGPAGG